MTVGQNSGPARELRTDRGVAATPRKPPNDYVREGFESYPAFGPPSRTEEERRLAAPSATGVRVGGSPFESMVRGAADANSAQPAAPAATTPAWPPSRVNVARALNEGFQYLIGLNFPEAASALRSSGSRGLALVEREGATRAQVQELSKHMLVFGAYNNAFQTQPGEKLPKGVPTRGSDGQWGERIPDYTHPAWQERRTNEAIDAAKMGFAGVMLDNVNRAGTEVEAAKFIAKMVQSARDASGNQAFAVILQNGEQLAAAHPWLINDGYVAALQKEDVSFRVTGAGSGTGDPVDRDERAEIAQVYGALRKRHPGIATIAVDYPSSEKEAALGLERAKALGFNVSHQAMNDGGLQRISRLTRVLRPIEIPR